LPGVVERFPIGVILMAPSFLDFRQASVAEVCEAIARAGVPIRLIQSGDELVLDREISCRVLHPPGDFRGLPDNAASVVLRIEFAGRVLLLTGDLEGAGLDLLLERKPQPVDVLLSPHHGSLAANPVHLAAWASPRVVIISTNDAASSARLRERYQPPCRLLSTAASGAITVTIRPDGALHIEPFRRTGTSEVFTVADVTP
jgi:competence protein ComEC